jgi:hypothetical protein
MMIALVADYILQGLDGNGMSASRFLLMAIALIEYREVGMQWISKV